MSTWYSHSQWSHKSWTYPTAAVASSTSSINTGKSLISESVRIVFPPSGSDCSSIHSLKHFASGHWFISQSEQNLFVVSQNSWNFKHFLTDTRHVCTYLNSFPMVIPNIVMKFCYFWEFGELLDLSSALAPATWKALRFTQCARLQLCVCCIGCQYDDRLDYGHRYCDFITRRRATKVWHLGLICLISVARWMWRFDK